jgi:hypothetical protein
VVVVVRRLRLLLGALLVESRARTRERTHGTRVKAMTELEAEKE